MTGSLLETPLPIVQAPMAGVQTSALAIAVAEAGGLGSLPCALLGPDAIRSELAAIGSASSAPINVNFFCHATPVEDSDRERRWRDALAPYFDELQISMDAILSIPARAAFDHDLADVVEEFAPQVMSFHFGLPSEDLVTRVRGWGAKVISSATSAAEAKWLQARGVDAVIAQGVEAGGHRGMFLSDDITTQVGTFALVPQVVRAVDVPVIAAGGIADAAGVAAAMALGASAVQVGTAYLLCDESLTTDLHRATLASEAAQATALTNLFTGRPARSIVNRLIRELGPMSDLTPEFPLAAAAVAPLRAAAERNGSTDFSPLWAGQNTTGCRAIGAAELTQALGSDLP